MVNPLYSFNYFPLVSGSGGQDSLDSFNSCSKRIHHPHGKSVSIRGRIKNHPHGKSVIFVFNYFPLVSGSVGQDSLYSFNSCSKEHYPHGKSVFICAICGRIK